MDNLRPLSLPATADPGADSASSSPGADHLDAIDVGDGAAGGELLDALLTREQFREAFGVAFKLAGSITGLQTLLAAPQSPESGPAADAVYEIAREVPWLSWLLQPAGIWLQRGLAIGAFAIPLAAGVSEELRARRAPPPAHDH